MSMSPQTPNTSAAPTTTKWSPAPRAVSMTGNTAPIPGADTVPTQAGMPHAAERGAASPEELAAGGAVGREEGAAGEGEGEGGEEQRAKSDPDVAWRLSVVAKKEREARALKQQALEAQNRLKSRESELAAREEALKAEEQKRSEWRKNPAALLRDHGFVPEAALQFLLNGEKLTPEQQLAATMEERLDAERKAREADLERLREETAEQQRAREEQERREARRQQAQAEQEAVAELHADIGAIIGEDPKAFGLVRKAGDRGVQAVFARVQELSNEQYESTGRRPPITTRLLERAAADIEAAAREELRSAALDPEIAEAIGIAPAQRGAPTSRPPATLTNRRVEAPPRPQQPPAQESEQERRARVLKQLDGIFQRNGMRGGQR